MANPSITSGGELAMYRSSRESGSLLHKTPLCRARYTRQRVGQLGVRRGSNGCNEWNVTCSKIASFSLVQPIWALKIILQPSPAQPANYKGTLPPWLLLEMTYCLMVARVCRVRSSSNLAHGSSCCSGEGSDGGAREFADAGGQVELFHASKT